MKIHVSKENSHALLRLEGRMDAAASQEAQTYIDEHLSALAPVDGIVCDASALEYISSSGLRVLLSLRKRFADFRMTEVRPDVYNVLEMTGFTKMMTVERALRELSVDGCEEIGRGGVGVVYRINDDTIIKVFREGTDICEVQREITMAKEAFVLGMPTAISFDVVRVGSQYGLVYELLKAETLSTIIAHDTAHLDDYAHLYADLFRQLHSIEVAQPSRIPSVIEREVDAVRHIGRYFDAASIDLLLEIVNAIPQANRLLHSDLQTRNAMMQNGELMLIDMGEVGYGHPMIDLGHAHSAMVAFIGDYEKVICMPREVGKSLWQKTMRYYFEGLPEPDFNHRMEQIETVGVVRNFSWMALSDSFPEEVVKECQQSFSERVLKHKDRLLDISRTFHDWTL